MQPRLFATAFSLLCFAAAVIAGVIVGNPSTTILGRGLAILGSAYVVGRVLGGVASAADWNPVGSAAEAAEEEERNLEHADDDARPRSGGSAFSAPATAPPLQKAA